MTTLIHKFQQTNQEALDEWASYLLLQNYLDYLPKQLKCHCQTRLTMTREVRGLSLLAIHWASSLRRPFLSSVTDDNFSEPLKGLKTPGSTSSSGSQRIHLEGYEFDQRTVRNCKSYSFRALKLIVKLLPSLIFHFRMASFFRFLIKLQYGPVL